MIGPQVQKSIYDALMDSPSVAGGRVYDRVPAAAQFPYVTIGDDQVIDDGNTCGDGWEVFANVHVWSREPGFPEAKSIAASVTSRISSIEEIPGFHLIEIDMRDVRARREPDGLTSHVICSFRFLIDPA